ncbi:TonB-dependent Receptor Plug Domain [Parasphingorhabdus marina DSM 22363]|uniref:TonB-dependent Receptor Plug Domain n=1 Tax=Parasphingorhabdus marina DSM 22363 TaxID=1123272 RepID=A0A1N6GX93_9SPHN|nr:TonB-dependent receptor plug domain-containing protein [Parasphingorhabdus marina]SIO12183.1 TonB-dependent Receptor Plug Domain [Parasphingorhabdus marina DSM 22363]
MPRFTSVVPDIVDRRMLKAAGLASLAFLPSPGLAQSDGNDVNPDDDIVVIAEFPRGSVVTDIPPVLELDAGDIDSFGASSVEDLLEAISSQTSSSRGRGSGRPVVLINGQRTSGFREVRDLPPEAIKNVQVFPEELAVQYGFRPDQRVINFILKEDYTGFSLEAEAGLPERGGQTYQEYESNLTRIGKNSRINLNLEYEQNGAITEAERGIVQDDAGAAVDLGQFRTLAPAEKTLEFNGNYSRTFENGTALSVNGDYKFEQSRALRGLAGASLAVPASSPFAVSPADETVERFFPELGALRRRVETHTGQAGFALNGTVSDWRWSLTGEYVYTREDTDTDQSGDTGALQAAVDAGTVDPFADGIGSLLGPGRTDRARSVSRDIDTQATASGTLFMLPAGPLTTTLRGGYDRNSLDSRDITDGIVTRNKLSRDIFSTGINIDIPLADENIDVKDAIGELSINGNLGYSELSDFGGLVEFGFGLNWEPLNGLVFSATAIGEDAAPEITQLGNPLIVTPNVTVFDFTNGETVLVDITTGGNFALPAEKRRDIKLAANYRPEWLDDLTLLAEYNRTNSTNVASSFPLLTPEIEAAFPDRVTRDGTGQLIAIDRRPVSYSTVRSDNIRYGFTFSKRFGQRRGNRPGGRPRRERGPNADETPPPGSESRSAGRPQQNARPGGRGGRPGGRRPGGRWRVTLYHTVNLEDRILIRPGVQELDLLDGSATGSDGGTPRHKFELSGGWFNKGIGFRVRGEHVSSTRVDGGLTGSDLRFSDLTTLNLRMFVNLNDRGNLTEKVKFLQNSRIALRIDNLFDDIQTVRDASGVVPLSYQPGFVDPVGRYFEISFRKRF